MSKKWFYSTELLTFDTQLIFKPALAIFPNDWHKARLLAHSVLFIIYLSSMIWMIKSSNIGTKGLWAVAMCSFPIGYTYNLTMSWSMCYVPYFVIAFASLTILMKAISQIRNRALYTILLIILSFISGIRSLRPILQFNIPLLICGLILLVLKKTEYNIRINSKFIRKFDKPLTLQSLLMLVSAIGGYLFNSIFLQKLYEYKNYNDSYWLPFSISRIANTLGDFIASYGWHEEASIISVEGFFSCFGLLLGIAVIVSVILLLFKYTHLLSDNEYLLILYTFVAIVISTFVLSLMDDYNYRYWVPVIPFGFISLAIAIKHLFSSFPCLEKIKYGIAVGSIVALSSLSWILMPWGMQGSKNKQLIPVVSWLCEQGYTKGISTFWYSNVTTELSDGHIDMWTINGFEKMDIQEWLQETSHSELPHGNIFVLINGEERATLDSGINEYIVYQNLYYTVLSFDEGTDYTSIITSSYIGK